MKHSELVSMARQWLISAKLCNPVFTEKGSARNNEFPDAIGWCSEGCIIVECKVSVQDFKKDQQKDFRTNGQGMGKYRFYLMPPEIYEVVKGNIPQGWGVVMAGEQRSPYQIRFMGSKEFESNLQSEINFLRSRILEIQRYGQ